ncbi:ATP-binding protein [Allostreptomyces psammosilenae]|uniref:Putative kinase n=1 Tax=Allostreptomyces psammosilenae TaxID=1892865 RepID=A0A852ZVW4_9ACTN|nr:ATP-binding protein [Allostreptomyces psammosilenae]NYI06533.1 putative kinase [Allostreptomyces psammosilenae]
MAAIPATGRPPRVAGAAAGTAVPAAIPAVTTSTIRTPAAVAGSAGAVVIDLRGRSDTRQLDYPAGDVLIVSGLPGSGKSTLMRRLLPVVDAPEQSGTEQAERTERPGKAGPAACAGGAVPFLDSQEVRERWAAALPAALPYALYRPIVRVAHYLGVLRALRAGGSVVVHDCGTLPLVRRWIVRTARAQGRAAHLLLLDVPPLVALAGQRVRGRTVTHYAFRRHLRAARRLVGAAEAGAGRLASVGVASVLLLDRPAADQLTGLRFGEESAGPARPAGPENRTSPNGRPLA